MGFFKIGSCGSGRYFFSVKIVDLFFQGIFCYLIKIVYFQDIIFRIQLIYCIYFECLFLEWGEFKKIISVDIFEFCFFMINEVFVMFQGEVDYIDVVYFMNFVIVFFFVDIFSDQFGSIE